MDTTSIACIDAINNLTLEVNAMAVFTCEKCGEKVETRCKPKKCPACSESGCMGKEEAPPPKKEKKK
jgi:rubrerythrin